MVDGEELVGHRLGDGRLHRHAPQPRQHVRHRHGCSLCYHQLNKFLADVVWCTGEIACRGSGVGALHERSMLSELLSKAKLVHARSGPHRSV